MNVSCSADVCPVILDSTCVFYSGGNLIYTGINTNDNLQLALQKIDAKFKNAAIGYIFNNGLIQAIPGGPVGLGGSLTQNTTINSAGFALSLTGTIGASSFITTGGTSSQFVKGDGSLDSTSYQVSGNYITALTGDGTASGPGSSLFTLSNTGVIASTYGSNSQVPVITVDAKGRITNITNTAINYPAQSILISGDVTGSGLTGANVTLTLNTVNSGVYPAITPLKFSVNGKGLVTGASPLTNLDLDTIYGYTPIGDAPHNGNTYGRKNGSWTIVSFPSITWGSITGTITAQTDLINYLSTNYTPQSRTLTINGVTYDLSANRSWTVSGLPSQTGNAGKWLTTNGSVASWATLSGNISLFTNDAGYINYIPTLQQVVTAGNSTTDKTISLYTSTGTTFVRLTDNQVIVWDTGTVNSQLFLEPTALTISNSATGAYINLDGSTSTPKLNVGAQSFTFPTGTSGILPISVNGVTANASTGNVTIPVGTGTVTSVGLSAGTGISLSGTNPITSSGTITVTNSAPDQTVAISAGTGIGVSGTYPNFTITNTSPSVGGGLLHATATGTDTYAATVTGVTSYTDGDAYLIRFTNGNTTGCTLNINSLGAIPLYRNNDGALIGGDIENNGEMLCVYDSSIPAFKTIGTSPNSLIAYVTNADSVSITKGMPVYAFSGTGDRMTVKRAYNTTDATSAQTIGLVMSSSIAAGQKGFIIMQGLLDGLNILPTSTWTDGDPVYLGATAGTITNVKQYAPNHLVYLGFVTTASNGSAGRLYVRVQNGYELDELHNVQAQTPSLNDTLYYDNATSPAQWKTASIPTILGYTPIKRSINVISTATAAGSAIATDYIYLVSGTTILTLPTAIGNTNQYTIKNVGTNTVSIATTSSQTIDGSSSPININVQYASLTLISDGANWNII